MTVFHRNETRDPLPEHLRGGVVAIGNFDGVHRGHQSVLNRALEEAKSRGVPALVLTFEPHPRTVFRPDTPVFRLTPAPLKARILEGMGFGAVIEYPFDRTFSQLSASDFIHRILLEWLHASHVVTGFDFHFGKGREGGPAFLMAAGGDNGFGVTLVDAFRDENASVISSSYVRALLGEGDVAQAAGMLGYRYLVEAEVIGGKKLGRELGFPTANMRLAPEVELRPGIYAVRFRRPDGSLYDGVASFGRRPTVDSDGEPLLETFVFDFSGDLYGKTVDVAFVAFLRGEAKFDALEALIVQMDADSARARGILAATPAFLP
jgi:riboflavin kinase/FMN adenylyltransferase